MKRSVASSVEVCSHSLGVGADDASFLWKPIIAFFARKNYKEVSLCNGHGGSSIARLREYGGCIRLYIDRSCSRTGRAGA